MPLIPSDFPSHPSVFDETPPATLAVTHAFTHICNVSDAKKNDVTQSYIQETANYVRKIKKRHETAGFSGRSSAQWLIAE